MINTKQKLQDTADRLRRLVAMQNSLEPIAPLDSIGMKIERYKNGELIESCDDLFGVPRNELPAHAALEGLKIVDDLIFIDPISEAWLAKQHKPFTGTFLLQKGNELIKHTYRPDAVA